MIKSSDGRGRRGTGNHGEGIHQIGTKPSNRRSPRNQSEGHFLTAAIKFQVQPVKRGWPDYQFVTHSGRFVAVEVKKSKLSKLKYDQGFVLQQLLKHGVDCYVWSPGGVYKVETDMSMTETTIYEVFK